THIFIDEYQDCGEIQHKIFLELINHGIKGIAVGDLNQAIFAFSYRFPKYLHSLIGNQDFRHVLLTRNFRCHKSISDYSLQLIEKRKVTNTDVKRVFKVNVIGNDKTVIDAIEKNFVNLKKKYKLNNNDFAILCHSRSSAKRASKFLNIKNKLFDYIDFEKETGILANFYKDLLNSYFLYKINKTTVLDFVIKYLNEEVNYFNFRKGLETVNEIFNLEVTNFVSNIEKFYDLAQLVYPDDFDEVIFNKLVELLKNRKDLNSFKPATEDEINIMTVHKSKGLEFKCVFLLDLYKYVFPRENIDEESLNQYLHLHYVGITRAIEACYIIVATERYRPSKEDYCNAIESPFLYRNNVQDLREDIIWKI
ncbi:TPA: ATP-dependent helicase, partial [Staphylococcus aureus]|nr:ATP-dependent helicase [Staphylococcus aureus]